MAINEQQSPEHPPRPDWNARETAIVLSLGLLLLSVAIDFMVDEKLDLRALLAGLPPEHYWRRDCLLAIRVDVQ